MSRFIYTIQEHTSATGFDSVPLNSGFKNCTSL